MGARIKKLKKIRIHREGTNELMLSALVIIGITLGLHSLVGLVPAIAFISPVPTSTITIAPSTLPLSLTALGKLAFFLNSFVTTDGLEMGRAQVAQAEAANIAPRVEMNPVLLKPTGNATSQVIINGRAVGVMSAAAYHQGYSLKAFDAVKDALQKLSSEFDTIIIEGAGSPAEVNLKANDIVNMRVAKYLNAPVILVADIDRGGALASIVGTLELLDECLILVVAELEVLVDFRTFQLLSLL